MVATALRASSSARWSPCCWAAATAAIALIATSPAVLAADLVVDDAPDNVGVVVTPSRRTDPQSRAVLREALTPLGGWVWDLHRRQPIFRHARIGGYDRGDAGQRVDDFRGGRDLGTGDGGAPAGPVAAQGLFPQTMMNEGRVRLFDGRFAAWPVTPLNDTPLAAAEMMRRLGL